MIALTYDPLNKTISIEHEGKLISGSFGLGELLVQFINLDWKIIQNEVTDFLSLSNLCESRILHNGTLSDIIEKINSFFNNLQVQHPYFVEAKVDILNKLRIYQYNYIDELENKKELYDLILENTDSELIRNYIVNNLPLPEDIIIGNLEIELLSLKNYLIKAYIFTSKMLQSVVMFCYFNLDEKYAKYTPFQKYAIYMYNKDSFLISTETNHQFRLYDTINKRMLSNTFNDGMNTQASLTNIEATDITLIETHHGTPRALLLLELTKLLMEDIVVLRCSNCSNFFIPISRSDEIYCSRLNSDGKSCKQLGWINKDKSEAYNEHRKNYDKLQKLIKRNLKTYPIKDNSLSLDEVFSVWRNLSVYKRDLCEEDILSLDEYQGWLEISSNFMKTITKAKNHSYEIEKLLRLDMTEFAKYLENM